MGIRHRTKPPALNYQINVPLATHWVEARCEEVDCPQYLQGWKTVLDPTNPSHADLIAYVRAGNTGRRYTEVKEIEGLVTFLFHNEQQCFRGHKRQSGRPPLFSSLRHGLHVSGRDFNEDMNEGLDQLRKYKGGQ